MPSREDLFLDDSEDPSNDDVLQNRHNDEASFVSLMSPTASCAVIDSTPIYVDQRPQDAPEILHENNGVRKTRSAMLANLLASDAIGEIREEDSRKENTSRQQGAKSGKVTLARIFSKRSFSFTKLTEKDRPEERFASGSCSPSSEGSRMGKSRTEKPTGSLGDSVEDSPRRRTTFGRMESVERPTVGSMNRGVTYAKGSEDSERTSFKLALTGDELCEPGRRKHSDEDLGLGRGSTQVVTYGSSIDTNRSRARNGTGSSELEMHAFSQVSEGSGHLSRSGHASSITSSDQSRSISMSHHISSPSVRCVSSAGSCGTVGTGHTSESSLLSRRRRNNLANTLSLKAKDSNTVSDGFTKLLEHRGFSVDNKIIGRSGNGSCKVMAATEAEGGQQVAIKCLCEARGEGVLHTILRREYELLSALHHPNIVKARTFLETDDQCGLVMELCSGISLMKYMPSWGGGRHIEWMMERCSVFEQVASTISYLHDNRVAHRDLHSENIVVNKSIQDRNATCVKVLDFGSARRVDDASVDGTDAASGMMFLDDLERRILPPASSSSETMLTSDVFALGLIAAGLVAKKPLLTKHVQGKGDPSTLVLCKSPNEEYMFSPRAETYLKHLLSFNPETRITARAALETLPPASEWFQFAATKMSL